MHQSPRKVEDAAGVPTDRPVLTFIPGAIIAREGERRAGRMVILAGVAEMTFGVHVLGRLGAGDEVPPGTGPVVEATVRAVTVVRAQSADRG